MSWQLAAEGVLLLHFAFALFSVAGGLLVLRWPWIAWLHLPAFAWSSIVNLAGWICPLTPLENTFRRMAGETGYRGSFIAHYITPVLYPAGMDREMELVAGISLPLWNALVYGLVLYRRRARGPR